MKRPALSSMLNSN